MTAHQLEVDLTGREGRLERVALELRQSVLVDVDRQPLIEAGLDPNGVGLAVRGVIRQHDLHGNAPLGLNGVRPLLEGLLEVQEVVLVRRLLEHTLRIGIDVVEALVAANAVPHETIPPVRTGLTVPNHHPVEASVVVGVEVHEHVQQWSEVIADLTTAGKTSPHEDDPLRIEAATVVDLLQLGQGLTLRNESWSMSMKMPWQLMC